VNKNRLHSYLQEYKNNFSRIHQEEIYKWQAVKQFQDSWDIQASVFHSMLTRSLSKSKNLLSSVKYFPRQMLIENAEKSPREIQDLFYYLFEEDFDLGERIAFFQKEFSKISRLNFPNSINTYQDHRAILVYLSLRYPERYYLYKYKMFKIFADKIEFEYKPIGGRPENIGQYHILCNLVRYEISNDQELLKLHIDRISDNCYYDKYSHILTQDFIYAVTQHLSIAVTSQKNKSAKVIIPNIMTAANLSVKEQSTNLKPMLINHIDNDKENKRIGDLGEQWVLNFERDNLIRAGKDKLAARIKHISSEKGDGSGFDIESFSEDGSLKFIDVKTTRGNLSQPFYVTRNELEKSRIEKDKYFLYRIYNYNESTDSAKIKIIVGDLTPLCCYPSLYKVAINEDSDI